MAPAVIVGLALTSCVIAGGAPIEEAALPGSDLVPTFSPQPTASPDGAVADGAVGATAPPEDPEVTGEDPGPGPAGDVDPTPPPTDAVDASPAPPPGPEPTPTVLRAAVEDAVGDVTLSAEPPPEHADLVRSVVIRDARGFEIRHEVLGGAPEDTDEQHTQNIATFFDVDGDGGVDFHVWANLSSSGWGSAYFDMRSGRARYADDDGVDVHVDAGGVVVVRFPHDHLADARSFRWSVGSEWGRYEVISTDAAARDSAPEDHDAVAFPD